MIAYNTMRVLIKSRLLSDLLSILISSLAGLGIFIVIFGGTGFLLPSNLAFLNGDSRAHYVSQLFFLSDSFRFPLGLNPNYGLELSYSSSINGPGPFILLAFQKLLGISPELQLYGFMTWFNLILHHQFARRILRLLGFKYISQHLFAFFFFTPFLLFRLEIHPLSVAIQWPILWAIYLLLKTRILGFIRYREVFFLVFISYSIFINLWFIVICVLLFQITQIELQHFELKDKVKIVWSKFHPIIIATFLASLLIDGLFFIGSSEVIDGFERFKTQGWGIYSFNPLSIINPDTGIRDEWYFKPDIGNAEGWNYNMSSSGFSLGMTYGSYEGYTYIGLGAILLGVIAFISLKKKSTRVVTSRITNLSLIYSAILFLYALAPTRITFGNLDIRIVSSYFQNLVQPLFPFRSSGRIMIVFGYLLIILFLVVIKRHFSKSMASALVSLCLVVQSVDLAGPLLTRFHYASSLLNQNFDWRQEVPDALTRIAEGKKELRIFPVENVIKEYDQLAWWAWNLEMGTNGVYSARSDANRLLKMTNLERDNICLNTISSLSLYAIQKSEFGLDKLKNCDLSVYSMTENDTWVFITKPK
jgi:hypothetical protein